MLQTGEDRYNQGKFEEDSWQNAQLESPGPDLVQGFWLKNFGSLNGREDHSLKNA